MKLLTRKTVQSPVSADAVSAVISIPTDSLVRRFGSQGDDWLGRPTLRYEDARIAHDEWIAGQNHNDLIRIRYAQYVDDRTTRRKECADAAAREVRTRMSPGQGGQWTERYMQEVFASQRRALELFDVEDGGEKTITQFRQENQ